MSDAKLEAAKRKLEELKRKKEELLRLKAADERAKLEAIEREKKQQVRRTGERGFARSCQHSRLRLVVCMVTIRVGDAALQPAATRRAVGATVPA